MNQSLSGSATRDQLARDLLESDSRYFEYGAVTESLDDAVMSLIPELVHVAAGCVVHRISPSPALLRAPVEWLKTVEARVRATGCEHPRFYLTSECPELEQAFSSSGYESRPEIGMLLRDPETVSETDVTLCAIETDDDWNAKFQIHEAGTTGPDDHQTSPEFWVELERRKSQDSSLQFFLVRKGNSICGSVGADHVGKLLRLKNLIVHSSWRRQGIGAGVVRRLGEMAIANGKLGMGVFGVPGRPGARLYGRLGLEPIVTQYEWIRRT